MKFSVPGTPKAQPRAKATTIGGRARMYTPKSADAFKASVALAAQQAGVKPSEGAVGIALYFVFPRPKNKVWKTRLMLTEYHTKKPDLDNLAKAVMDALDGIAWRDDAQVAWMSLSKVIAEGDEASQTIVKIVELKT